VNAFMMGMLSGPCYSFVTRPVSAGRPVSPV
jgi:hypothetical protein